MERIGLIPAAGHGTRIAPLPCSKELYPIGFRSAADGGLRPKVASHYLLEKFTMAGVKKCYVIVRAGKWDIPAYWQDGALADMALSYVVVESTPNVPSTLDRAHPFVTDAIVVLGFPDILFRPDDAISKVVAQQATTGADLVLGAFPAHDRRVMDMLELDRDGRVKAVLIQPSDTNLQYCWIFAVWSPVFQRFLHDYVAGRVPSHRGPADVELIVGHVIQAALKNGLRVEAVVFSDGEYLDIGTPEHLERASQFARAAVPRA